MESFRLENEEVMVVFSQPSVNTPWVLGRKHHLRGFVATNGLRLQTICGQRSLESTTSFSVRSVCGWYKGSQFHLDFFSLLIHTTLYQVFICIKYIKLIFIKLMCSLSLTFICWVWLELTFIDFLQRRKLRVVTLSRR